MKENFGAYLKELRGDKSLREMQRITGVSHTYISVLEKGVDPRSGNPNSPTPEVLKKLAEPLGVTYEHLMVEAGLYNGEIDTLTKKIEQWAIDRNLHTADPVKQMLKLGEEYGELCAAMARNDWRKTVDSIGDMFVVMTIFCKQMDIDFETCIEWAYDEIKDRKGKLVNGVYIKEADLNGQN